MALHVDNQVGQDIAHLVLGIYIGAVQAPFAVNGEKILTAFRPQLVSLLLDLSIAIRCGTAME